MTYFFTETSHVVDDSLERRAPSASPVRIDVDQNTSTPFSCQVSFVQPCRDRFVMTEERASPDTLYLEPCHAMPCGDLATRSRALV